MFLPFRFNFTWFWILLPWLLCCIPTVGKSFNAFTAPTMSLLMDQGASGQWITKGTQVSASLKKLYGTKQVWPSKAAITVAEAVWLNIRNGKRDKGTKRTQHFISGLSRFAHAVLWLWQICQWLLLLQLLQLWHPVHMKFHHLHRHHSHWTLRRSCKQYATCKPRSQH